MNKAIKFVDRPLHILWSNRWEHDKNPDEFFAVLIKLHEMQVDYRLHVIGEQFSEMPGYYSICFNFILDLQRKIYKYKFSNSLFRSV